MANFQRLGSHEERPSWLGLLLWLEWFALGVAVFLFVFYFSFQVFHARVPLDTELWGQFGDVIGGVVGTIIAYISIRLLVKTLFAQLDANNKAKEIADKTSYTSLTQQYQDKFNLLIKLYEEELSKFGNNNEKGQKYLQTQLNSMFNRSLQTTNPNDSYSERLGNGVKQFNGFYANNRHQSSVYFRLIYRVFNVLYYSGLKNEDQLPYAKIFRCQLSEEELFYLRYNAFTDNGKKMRQYINSFNLLKHLPIMSLLEFAHWKNRFPDNIQAISLLDTYFFTIRKQMIALCNKEDVNYKRSTIGNDAQKYITRMAFSSDNKVARITVIRKPLATTSDLERVLDALTIEDIKDLLIDFCYELFVYSNFEEYMQVENMEMQSRIIQDEGNESAMVQVNDRNRFALVLSQDQLNSPQ